jgi:NAD+ synthase (glutamine-hydrolysing)
MLFTLCQLNPTVGDLKNNSKKIIEAIETAKSHRSDLVITSELALTGYPPLDLLFEKKFIDEVEQALMHIIPHTRGITALIGLPRKNLDMKEKFLFNSTAILQDGYLIGFYDKKLLPTYDVFDEKRYFEEGKKSCILNIKGKKVGLSICEDVWNNSLFVKETLYSTNPLQAYEKESIDLLINQASSPYHFGKSQLREKLMHEISSKLGCKVVFLNQVGANDGLLFDGNSFICDGKQNIAYKSMCFEEDVKTFCIDELNPTKNELDVIRRYRFSPCCLYCGCSPWKRKC